MHRGGKEKLAQTKTRICRKDISAYKLIRAGVKVSPYVGIIQIRLRVRAIQPTLSLLTQAPLVNFITIPRFAPFCKRVLQIGRDKPLINSIVTCAARRSTLY